MVRKIISKRSTLMYKRPYYKDDTFKMRNGQAMIAYCRTILNVNFDAFSNIQGELEHSVNLPNSPEYQNTVGLWRKANILKANAVFMPAGQLTNSTSSSTVLGPVFIAPYHGEYVGVAFSYGRLGMPGTVMSNPVDPSRQRRCYWYKKDDLPDFETDASAPTGRKLDTSYGGFLIFADGSGFVTGTQAGHLIITYKVLFKDRKVIS